jgi:hypothetical protein
MTQIVYHKMHMLDDILKVYIGINSKCLVKINATPSFHTTHNKIHHCYRKSSER